MKMKIGILTFHKSINYGAYMQCYALSTTIQKDFPNCDVEVIDYSTKRMMDSYSANPILYVFSNFRNIKKKGVVTTFKISIKRFLDIVKNPMLLKKQKQLIRSFMNDWERLPLSKEFSIVNDDYRYFFNEIKDKYDIIVVGSDCVWEFLTYPFPNAYFLNDDICKHKLSYAASSDRMYYDLLKGSEKQYINRALKSFRYIGVRDNATEQFLGSINNDFILKHNCDPTILLDMSTFKDTKEKVKGILSEYNIDIYKPFIIVMGTEEIGKIASETFGKEYPIIAIYNYNPYADVFIDNLSPIEWSQIFGFAKIVYTNYFHGTILSLKNNVPSMSIDYAPINSSDDITKIKDLLTRLDLLDFYHTREQLTNNRNYIIGKGKKLLMSDYTWKIQSAIEKEKKSYDNFKDELIKIQEEFQK